jgi:predicted RNA-binding Zn-ribbon protein involved in translation (DUF1610 family)
MRLEFDIVIIVLFIFVAYLICTILYKLYLPKIKGSKGEHSIAKRLQKLNRNKYIIFNDVYLKIDGRSTQIDHLVISIYGIFVIETKNYNGWIHGSEKSEYWTQTFYKKRTRFRNPIKQNWSHIYFLKNVLSNFKQVKYHPIIVFTGKAKLKNIYAQTPVIYKHKLIKTIKQNKTPCLTIEQAKDIAEQLKKFIIIDKKIIKEHKKYIKKNIRERANNIKSLTCPNCGGELVIRNGKYGKFYGCSNYPKCKFSRNIQ